MSWRIQARFGGPLRAAYYGEGGECDRIIIIRFGTFDPLTMGFTGKRPSEFLDNLRVFAAYEVGNWEITVRLIWAIYSGSLPGNDQLNLEMVWNVSAAY